MRDRTPEIVVEAGLAARALAPIERMLELSR
jgi:hypothetical protein